MYIWRNERQHKHAAEFIHGVEMIVVIKHANSVTAATLAQDQCSMVMQPTPQELM